MALGYRYGTPEIQVGNLTLDAEALNAYIARAESAYDKPQVEYAMATKAYGDPSLSVDQMPELQLDCSGYAWWSTYRKRKSDIWDAGVGGGWADYWVEVPDPIPGSVVRYGAPPGASNGHVGVVIGNDGGTFQTLDSTDSPSPPRKGSIRYTADGRTRWYKGPQTRFVVSKEAVIAVDGKPVKRPLNVWLAAAKRPILSTLMVLAIAGGAYWVYRRRKQGLPLFPQVRT